MCRNVAFKAEGVTLCGRGWLYLPARANSQLYLVSVCFFVSICAYFSFINKTYAENVQIYKDKNGYFVAIPPTGWHQQDHPSETIRSKVTFANPTDNSVNIQIIAGPTPTDSFTLDDLYKESQEKINTVLRPKFPTASFTVKKVKIDDRDAVIQRNSSSGLVEQEIVNFINRGVYYSIALNANINKKFEDSHDTFEQFINSFIIIDRGKKFSEKEIQNSIIAKYKSIADSYEKMGKITDALTFLEEGLSIVPNSEELKDYKRRLQVKQKSK